VDSGLAGAADTDARRAKRLLVISRECMWIFEELVVKQNVHHASARRLDSALYEDRQHMSLRQCFFDMTEPVLNSEQYIHLGLFASMRTYRLQDKGITDPCLSSQGIQLALLSTNENNGDT
jgi:hypothetical protein